MLLDRITIYVSTERDLDDKPVDEADDAAVQTLRSRLQRVVDKWESEQQPVRREIGAWLS